LQVKILSDPKKYGWKVPELLVDLPELDRCQNLDIQGLMTILPLGLSSATKLSTFQETQKLAINIQQQNYSHLKMQQLSMGMSDDYLEAIEAGATMIRLGSLIFGARG
jgi:pyridoxal phosphate enzyme (YggS family)